jgi:hypothetical protein
MASLPPNKSNYPNFNAYLQAWAVWKKSQKSGSVSNGGNTKLGGGGHIQQKFDPDTGKYVKNDNYSEEELDTLFLEFEDKGVLNKTYTPDTKGLEEALTDLDNAWDENWQEEYDRLKEMKLMYGRATPETALLIRMKYGNFAPTHKIKAEDFKDIEDEYNEATEGTDGDVVARGKKNKELLENGKKVCVYRGLTFSLKSEVEQAKKDYYCGDTPLHAQYGDQSTGIYTSSAYKDYVLGYYYYPQRQNSILFKGYIDGSENLKVMYGDEFENLRDNIDGLLSNHQFKNLPKDVKDELYNCSPAILLGYDLVCGLGDMYNIDSSNMIILNPNIWHIVEE